MPELVMAISARLVIDRTFSGSALRGTRRPYLDHPIAEFGRKKLTFGGMSPVSKMPHTLQRDARNEAISRWLIEEHRDLVGELYLGSESIYAPDVTLQAADDEFAVPLESFPYPVGFGGISLCRPYEPESGIIQEVTDTRSSNRWHAIRGSQRPLELYLFAQMHVPWRPSARMRREHSLVQESQRN